ncbi:MAG: ATP-binding protein [Gemmatimonadota bacterium]
MTTSRELTGLGLVGAVAKLLKAGNAAEITVSAVAALLRDGVNARSIAIWFREGHATTFSRVVAGPEDAEPLREQAEVPERHPDADRFHLVHEAEWLGVVEVIRGDQQGAEDLQVMQIVSDLLAPFLGALELSEDLAYEVALRSHEIEEQRRFTTLVIDSLPVGLYVVDRGYRIQIWNRKREMGTQGLRRDEVVGRSIFDVLTRQSSEELRAEIDQVFATGAIQQVELEVGTDDERRSYRISKIPMRLDGDEITHVITIGEDVTLWHTVQQQILQSEKLAAIGQLAAGIMHEINNPLATIGACVAALENQIADAPVAIKLGTQEYLDIIDKEVQRCTRIVDGLLDFSRPKGKAKRIVRIATLLEDTLFLLKHHKGFRKLDVRLEVDPALPDIHGNDEQLIQAFMAIMLNAIDAMEDGGDLRVHAVMNPHREDEVMIEFHDSGAGIPRAELSKIFEPFYTTKPQGRGTGLGLSICYGIIEQHGGRIEADSLPGKGATFRVFLPVAAPS